MEAAERVWVSIALVTAGLDRKKKKVANNIESKERRNKIRSAGAGNSPTDHE